MSETTSTATFGGWVDRTTYTYSVAGAETASISSTDFDGNGVPELSRRTTIEYTPSNDAMAPIVDQYLGTPSLEGYVVGNQPLSSIGARN